MQTKLNSILVIFLILISISSSYGQNNNHEIKVNPFYAALGIIDVHYEKISPGNFSFGASINANLRWDEYLGSIVIFGRAYGIKSAQNLYFEIHHATHLDGSCTKNQVINYIGPAIGYKYLMKRNFSFELLVGVGFKYLDPKCEQLANLYYPRLGILIGKRF